MNEAFNSVLHRRYSTKNNVSTSSSSFSPLISCLSFSTSHHQAFVKVARYTVSESSLKGAVRLGAIEKKEKEKRRKKDADPEVRKQRKQSKQQRKQKPVRRSTATTRRRRADGQEEGEEDDEVTYRTGIEFK